MRQYRKKTKQKVVSYLKQNDKVFYKEITRLGTKKAKIDRESLNEILKDLKLQKKITESSLGRFRVIEWNKEL
jgi:ABC-type transport system involved in cytochrome bd biosynthesis fused ATPase/permease subunit